MAESDIYYVEWGADHDGAMEKWLRPIFCRVRSISVSEIVRPKWAWKTCFYRNIWNAAAGQRRQWRQWNLLGMKVLIKHFKKSGLAPETMLRTQRSRPFFNLEKTGHFWHFINGGTAWKIGGKLKF